MLKLLKARFKRFENVFSKMMSRLLKKSMLQGLFKKNHKTIVIHLPSLNLF